MSQPALHPESSHPKNTKTTPAQSVAYKADICHTELIYSLHNMDEYRHNIHNQLIRLGQQDGGVSS